MEAGPSQGDKRAASIREGLDHTLGCKDEGEGEADGGQQGADGHQLITDQPASQPIQSQQ